MEIQYIALIFATSFLTTYLFTPVLIRYLKRVGLVVRDENKEHKPLIPISGGLAVMAGIFIGLSTYISIRTFIYHDSSLLLDFFAALTTIILITLIGYIDDSIVPSDKSSSAGLRQWQKPLLTLVAAIPLITINAGTTTVALPYFGLVDLGLLYPLFIVPAIVVVASNMVNMYAGLNGLEAGLGIINMGMLGLYAAMHDRFVAAIVALSVFAALIAFIRYNWTPASILPGDSLTYLIGGAMACIAILGNIEKAVVIVSIPFAIEFFLKARARFKAKSYGKWVKGTIHSHHGQNIYSLPHLFMRTGKFGEQDIVILLLISQFIVSAIIWFV